MLDFISSRIKQYFGCELFRVVLWGRGCMDGLTAKNGSKTPYPRREICGAYLRLLRKMREKESEKNSIFVFGD